MTVSYTAEVATSGLGTFLRLLGRWKGSVYKLLWKEFVLYALMFATLSCLYRVVLTKSQKIVYEHIALYCNRYAELIPLSFVLGFYVSIVVTRWWNQFYIMPWPDRMALFVMSSMQGSTERARMMRRAIMRYMCLSFTMTLSSMSSAVKKRFPTLDNVSKAGFLTENEKEIIENLKTPHNKYFVPLVWATSLIMRARKENLVKDDMALKTLIDEVNTFRGGLGMLLGYDWISVPLVYTQVVTLAVHTFFLGCLMGRQFIVDKLDGNINIDPYIPFFTFLQFFFYMGWLKVAESLVNPFGEDDDDFDINMLIDRNLQVSYLIVDEMHSDHPELIKDQYWDDVDFKMPYTEASKQVEPFVGSTLNLHVPAHKGEFIEHMDTVLEEEEEQLTGGARLIPRVIRKAYKDLASSTSPTFRDRIFRPNLLRQASRDRSKLKHVPGTVYSSRTSFSSRHQTPSHDFNPDGVFDLETLSNINYDNRKQRLQHVDMRGSQNTLFSDNRSIKTPVIQEEVSAKSSVDTIKSKEPINKEPVKLKEPIIPQANNQPIKIEKRQETNDDLDLGEYDTEKIELIQPSKPSNSQVKKPFGLETEIVRVKNPSGTISASFINENDMTALTLTNPHKIPKATVTKDKSWLSHKLQETKLNENL